MIQIDPTDLTILLVILKKHIPSGTVWAFGSRVQGNARPFSDLDLALIQDDLIDLRTKAELRYQLSESRLPIRIDLIEWRRAHPEFREAIRQNHLRLKEARPA